MNAKSILRPHLSDEEFAAIAQSVTDGYAACDRHFDSHIVTSRCVVGMELRSYCINAFVQHQLAQLCERRPEFFCEFKTNKANNNWHLRLHRAPRFTLTSHFLGRNQGRSSPKEAIYRGDLAARNYDLFGDADAEMIDRDAHVYCQLWHAGFFRPELVMLAIPGKSAASRYLTLKLDLPEPKLTGAEQIREEMTIRLLSVAAEDDDESKTG